MTTATVEQLKKEFEESPVSASQIAYHMGFSAHKFDATLAQRWLDNHKARHLNHDLGKGARPWDIINVTAKLDPKQPWIGVEYETGYASNKAYQSVINYLWQNHPFTAIDREGCGAYPCEITFSPVNLTDFMSDDYSLDKLIGWTMENGANKQDNDGRNVGTHVNVSTPKYRKLSGALQQRVVLLLNKSAYSIKAAHHKALWGRAPYGYFYAQSPGPKGWIEGKMFDSVGTVEAWRAYKPIMARIATLLDAVSASAADLPEHRVDGNGKKINPYESHYGKQRFYVITNMAEFLLGQTDEPELAYVESADNY